MKEKKRFQPKKVSPETIEAIENQVAEIAEVIVSANYFVVEIRFELENGRWYLRIFLDHPNEQVRVTLDDCKDISEALAPMIEAQVKELTDFPYSMEVSSPGLFRELSHPPEFSFYQGRRIEIQPKGQDAFIAYLAGFNRATQELSYRLSPDTTQPCEIIAWAPKAVKISLAPDLTVPLETKTVPRRIHRYD